jgi:hypothetical protein
LAILTYCIDARSQSSARNILRETLININFTKASSETCSRALTLEIGNQICTSSIILAWNRGALVNVHFTVLSRISQLTFAFGCVISQANRIIFAWFHKAEGLVTESTLKAFSAQACKVVSSRQVYK